MQSCRRHRSSAWFSSSLVVAMAFFVFVASAPSSRGHDHHDGRSPVCAQCVAVTKTKTTTAYNYATKDKWICVPTFSCHALRCMVRGHGSDCPKRMTPVRKRIPVKHKVTQESQKTEYEVQGIPKG